MDLRLLTRLRLKIAVYIEPPPSSSARRPDVILHPGVLWPQHTADLPPLFACLKEPSIAQHSTSHSCCRRSSLNCSQEEKKTKPDHTRSIKPPGDVQSRRAAFERDRTPLINTSLSRLERVRLTCLCVAGSLCVSGEQGGRAASLFSLSHSFGPSGFIEQLKRSLNPPSEPTRLSREVVPGIPWSWPLPSPPHLYFSVLSNPTQLNVFFNMLLRRWTSCRYRHRAIWMQAGFKTYFRCDIWQRCLENQDKPVQLWDAPTVLNQPLLHEQRSCVRSHTLHGFPERAEDRNVRKWSKILQSLVDWYCFHCYLAPPLDGRTHNSVSDSLSDS